MTINQGLVVIVLSLFDGISCGQIALNRIGLVPTKYFSSEIDKSAIKITQDHYPNTVQLGDITKLSYRKGVLHSEKGEFKTDIDMVIGGSPCTSFSGAGSRKGFEGESGLFWHFARILKEVRPTYFLLENVIMKKEWQTIIDHEMGVTPIRINSLCVSAQFRSRLYWTNIKNIAPLPNKSILLKDILEPDYSWISKYLLKENKSDYLLQMASLPSSERIHIRRNKLLITDVPITVEPNTSIEIHFLTQQGPLTRKYSGTVYGHSNYCVINWNGKLRVRSLTPLECERLQTLDDNWTQVVGVSDNQRYLAIGNGWTVDVIAHIFNAIKSPSQDQKINHLNILFPQRSKGQQLVRK